MKGYLMSTAQEISDHIEHRLRTWIQLQMNRYGDRLSLDDYMNADAIADLIDFVCDEYALNEVMSSRSATDCGEAGHNEGRCGNSSCIRA